MSLPFSLFHSLWIWLMPQSGVKSDVMVTLVTISSHFFWNWPEMSVNSGTTGWYGKSLRNSVFSATGMAWA
ncbi:hypothetical protein D3C87_2170420 [compost metagenome]